LRKHSLLVRRSQLLLILTLGSLLSLLLVRSFATTWPGPIARLSNQEKLEFAVSSDQLIDLVTIIRFGYTTDADGALAPYIHVHPVRWFNGSAKYSTIRVYADPVALGRFYVVHSWALPQPGAAILIASTHHGKTYADQGPWAYMGGIIQATPEQIELVEAQVSRARQRQSIAGLAAVPPTVLVGRFTDQVSCAIDEHESVCSQVAVDSVTTGDVSEHEIVEISMDRVPGLLPAMELLQLLQILIVVYLLQKRNHFRVRAHHIPPHPATPAPFRK
jgi:hypothetical protein